MKRILIFLCLLSVNTKGWSQLTPYEQSADRNRTATYEQIIPYYESLARQYKQIKVLKYGDTDSGLPLHLVVLSRDKIFTPAEIRKQNRRVLLINNGIHPGEPEGIDASMMLARDLLKNDQLPKDVVICFVPVYNIGGALNRGTTRANQNGPETYGFRGNARNLDLNRDFIKTDSRNSLSFQQLFSEWQPDVLIDNHTSNGADYQYNITLIETQKDKLNPVLSKLMTEKITPELYKRMEGGGTPMIPYVDFDGETPESGLRGFLETPRYSTGYAALHNTIAYMTETHMWKPFSKRVAATYDFMKHMIDIVNEQSLAISKVRKQTLDLVKKQKVFPLAWKLDETQVDSVWFKGYEAFHKPSDVSGVSRLYYDRSKPFERRIASYNKFVATDSVEKPLAYIIPQAWGKVIELLKTNNVMMTRLAKDSELLVQMYYIKDYKTSARPYEGHYLHNSTKVSAEMQKIRFHKGDYVVQVNQCQNRYIVETLEPQSTDSFFNWNFFDSILGQKEYFSAYIFEDTAAEMLANDADLRKRFDLEKSQNPEFSKSGSAQLNWLYKNSRYYEKTHMRYPIGRLLTESNLDTN